LPNIKSAIKRVKTNKRDEIRNRNAKATLKTALKKTSAAVTAGEAESKELVQSTQALIARTWKRGIIHKNKAARLQSRMMKQATKSAQK
jgi:small subunit ribosomal protein S20